MRTSISVDLGLKETKIVVVREAFLKVTILGKKLSEWNLLFIKVTRRESRQNAPTVER